MTNKPVTPSIDLEGLMQFYLFEGETFTNIPIVDAVLSATHTITPHKVCDLCKYLGVSERLLNCTMQLCCGCTTKEYLLRWKIERLRRIFLSPDIHRFNTDEIAVKAGFSDCSSIAKLLKSKKYRHYFADIDLAELRPERYVKTGTRNHPQKHHRPWW